MVCNSNEGTSFPNKLLLTNKYVMRLCKAFLVNSSVNLELLKI